MILIESSLFTRFIVICVVLNSVAESAFDFNYENKCAQEEGALSCPYSKSNTHNQILHNLNYIFVVIFILEAAIKILALGCCSGNKTYFKNSWNILDFVIVLSSIFEISAAILQVNFINMRFLRTIRILRPLKAMKTIPSIRKQIQALTLSMKGLINVAIFLAFFILLLGIMGL